MNVKLRLAVIVAALISCVAVGTLFGGKEISGDEASRIQTINLSCDAGKYQTDGNKLCVRCFIDPRFRLRKSSADALTKDKNSGFISALGKPQEVIINNISGKFSYSLEIEAKPEFVGGRNINLINEGSGLYCGDKLIKSFDIVQGNIKTSLLAKSIEVSLFYGKTLNDTERDILGEMFDASFYSDLSLKEGRKFYCKWFDESENELSYCEIMSLKPNKDRSFKLIVSYSYMDNTKENEIASAEAELKVNLASGRIRIIKECVGGETGKSFTVYLKGDNYCCNKTVLSGESIIFDGLSEGDYTLSEKENSEYRYISTTLSDREYASVQDGVVSVSIGEKDTGVSSLVCTILSEKKELSDN